MIVRQFLLWARTAAPGPRAEAVAALARAYLDNDLLPEDRRDARTALTAMLDDPSPLVRVALAETLADSADAPRHLIVALASDQSAVAAVVLARSPVLADADLIDCAALGDECVQTAIARRPYVSVAVSAALAEIGAAAALSVLAANPGAEIADLSLWRMVERHGSHPTLREGLLARPGLPLDIRHATAVAISDELALAVRGSGWLGRGQTERVRSDARDRMTVALTVGAPQSEVERLVSHLRRSRQLTPAQILRALLSGNMAFVEASFSELTRLPPSRVAALLHDRRAAGFSALYGRAGLPRNIRPAFEAAISAFREMGGIDTSEAQLSLRMIERVLSACADLAAEEAGKLMALLRRFEAEAAREEARDAADALADEAAVNAALNERPLMLIGVDRDHVAEAA
jgi:uncharacterized protein (DUF2336 family)